MSAPPPFEVHAESGRVTASGELDIETAPQLRAAIDGASELTLDLREVTFIDSTGLSLLIELAQSGKELTILPSESVTRLAELCGLRDTLPLRG